MLKAIGKSVLFGAFALASVAFAQEGPLMNTPPRGISEQEIIQRFAAREKEFSQARERYTYQESVKIDTLDADGQSDGTYQQTWDINFDSQGRRFMNVTYAPQPTLYRVQMTKEDLNDVQNVMPFVLTTDDLPNYDVQYLGQQKEDELNTYVFEIAPKKIEKDRRYFQGRIWVDQKDLQIVKTYGKSVPDIRHGKEENLFPRFTTYREQVDGVYWFPTYTRADDTLHFKDNDVRIRIVIRFTNYKRFGSESKIVFNGQTVPNGSDTPPPSGPPAQQPNGTATPPQQ